MEQRKYILSSRSNQISIEPIKTRRNFLKSFSTNHGLKLKKKEEEDEFEDAAACYNVGIKERNVRKKKKGAIRCLAYQKLRGQSRAYRNTRRERRTERERRRRDRIILRTRSHRSRHCLKPVRADSSLHIHSFLRS